MSHPVTNNLSLLLSPSPLHLAYDTSNQDGTNNNMIHNNGIWQILRTKLELSKFQESLLISAEENPMEYTLADPNDAIHYSQLLLQLLDKVTGPTTINKKQQQQQQLQYNSDRNYHNNKQKRNSANNNSNDSLFLSQQEANQVLQEDPFRVVMHYVIDKLYQVLSCLRDHDHSTSSSPSTATANNQRRQMHKKSSQVCQIFYKHETGTLIEEWRPLLRILYMGGVDVFAQRGASLCLAFILQAGCNNTTTQPHVEEPLQALINWITSRLQSSSASSSIAIVTPALTVLSTCPQARVIIHRVGGIGYMTRHLKLQKKTPVRNNNNSGNSNTNIIINNNNMITTSVQQLYELCFCLWTLSLDCCITPINSNNNDNETNNNNGSAISSPLFLCDDSLLTKSQEICNHFQRDGAIPALCDLIAAAPREKVVRLAIATLCNLAQASSSWSSSTTTSSLLQNNNNNNNSTSSSATSAIKTMMTCGLLKSIIKLRDRKWVDEDIPRDLKTLHDTLQANFQEMTRWQVYQAEIESGQLHWGIVHSEKFFKENARQMEGTNGDFRLVKRLVRIVANHTQELDETVAIACYDLGEFVRHYPNGRLIAKSLGAKDIVMTVMDHECPQVQHHALLCVSKMLVLNWKSIHSLS